MHRVGGQEQKRERTESTQGIHHHYQQQERKKEGQKEDRGLVKSAQGAHNGRRFSTFAIA